MGDGVLERFQGWASSLMGLSLSAQAEFAQDLGERNAFAPGERSPGAGECLVGLGGDFVFFDWRVIEQMGEWLRSFRRGKYFEQLGDCRKLPLAKQIEYLVGVLSIHTVPIGIAVSSWRAVLKKAGLEAGSRRHFSPRYRTPT